MSVLIKGITLEQFYRDLNNVRDMDVGWDVVQLPPHGRLIDADAEIEVWDVCGRQGVFPHSTTTVSKFLLGHLVGKIPPTIIESEEEDDKDI